MIQKIEIETISDNIKLEIKRNFSSLGFDVAQNKTGVCLLRTDEKFLYIELLENIIVKKGKNGLHQMIDIYLHEAIQLREKLEKIKVGTAEKILVIEDCWFGKSVWTTKILAKYALLVYLVFRKWAKYAPDPIQPSTARKKIGFLADSGEFRFITDDEGDRKKVWDRKPDDIKEQVRDYLEDNIEVKISDEDLADGFVLALSGLIE